MTAVLLGSVALMPSIGCNTDAHGLGAAGPVPGTPAPDRSDGRELDQPFAEAGSQRDGNVANSLISRSDAAAPTDGRLSDRSSDADRTADASGTSRDVMIGPATGGAGCTGDGSACDAMPNLAQGGVVTSSSPNVPPEDMTKAFDGRIATKWYAGNGIRTGWLAYQFAGAASHTVTSYAVTSANDFAVRDPMNWQLDGSNDGTNWTLVDGRIGQVFTNRFQTNSYVCATSGPYQRYRLNVTANNGGTELQLAEIQLFGY
jgi:hypothetical protein